MGPDGGRERYYGAAMLKRISLFALLFIALLFFGVWQRTLTEKIQPAAQRILEMATAKQPAPATTSTTTATVARVSSIAPLERTE